MMKKSTYIILAVAIALVLVMVFGIMFLFFGGENTPEPEETLPRKNLTIYDSQGDPMITTDHYSGIYDQENWAYLELVLEETAAWIAEQESCSMIDAREHLFTRGYQIYTAYDAAAFKALKAIPSRWGTDACHTAAVLTDLKGSIVAAYCCNADGKYLNYALERRSPYSSFKALSVYTPAVEQGIVNWSSVYTDSPYKKLKGEDGSLQDWPANASGSYSMEPAVVYDALRKSLNTVAVRCLKDVGVKNAMDFLQNAFGIPLKEETFVLANYGEEEVIGNIALGYLETGITPVEMAGYYQIFANGGFYASPKAVTCIKGEDGTVLYKPENKLKQVISPATADTMNKLLQGVVKTGGTGAAAASRDVEIAGKTGTGDDYADNWFVGVTPGYSLAVWHGSHDSNQAAEMFAAVIQRLYSDLPEGNRKFITHHNLVQIVYCEHSGKAFSENCTRIDVGYYASKDALSVCDACKKKAEG